MPREAAVLSGQDPTNQALRRRAEAEYLEMPGLKLTAAQASRFWHLDAASSTMLLDAMVDDGFLFRARDGAYVLLSAR
jgi:hypothetical protein